MNDPLPRDPVMVAGQRVFLGHSSTDGMPFLDDGSVDLVLTSPPYAALKKYTDDPREVGRGTYTDYLDALDRVWAAAWRVLRPGGALVVNTRDVQQAGEFLPISADITVRARAAGWKILPPLVWHIPNALPSPDALRERQFDIKSEAISCFAKPGAPHYLSKPRVPHAVADPRPGKQNPNGRCLGSVIRCPAYRPPNVAALGYHQAAWPDELAALLVEAFCPPAGHVLDPFLGSGTTLKVARHLGRAGTGVELDSRLLPLIERRVARESFRMPDWAELDAIVPYERTSARRADLATGGEAPLSLFDQP